MQQKPSFIDHRARTILGAVLMFCTTLPTVPARAQTFADVSGSLKQISASSDGTVVYGVNSSNQVWSLSGSTWTKLAGISLSQVSVGSASAVWGVDPTGAVYHFNPATNSFQKMPGTLTEISAGSDGTVVGVDSSGNIQKWNGSAWTAQ